MNVTCWYLVIYMQISLSGFLEITLSCFLAVISEITSIFALWSKTEKDSIMETIANTYDDIITRSYEEYYQVILTYITYRITHRYEAEDLTQDVFVRLLDYKQMLRPDTVKYFLFTIARNIVIDYIRRYYKKQEIDSYIYDTMSTSTNETEEKIIGDDLMTMERTRLAAMPEQRRLIYTLNRFENKTSPEIANE